MRSQGQLPLRVLEASFEDVGWSAGFVKLFGRQICLPLVLALLTGRASAES